MIFNCEYLTLKPLLKHKIYIRYILVSLGVALREWLIGTSP